MGKIQNFKRIIVEDYDVKDRPLVGKIGGAINIFAEDVQNILNNNISIKDNLNWSQKVITVTVNASGVPTTQTILKSGLSSPCVGTQVIKAINLTHPATFPLATPFISFSDNEGLLTIGNIKGLTTGDKYQLTVILYS